MRLKWHGHSCFELTLDNGYVIVTDPFDDSVGYPSLRLKADAVLTSHGHYDHNYLAAVAGEPVVVREAGEYALGGAKITAVSCFHDDQGGAKRGPNLIFRVEADGVVLAHLGDLGHLPDTDAQRAALSGLDAMLIPIGGYYTIDTPSAVRLIEAFKPRCAVAMHFRNRYCGFPVSDEGEFVRLTGAKRLPNAIELPEGLADGCAVMELP